MKNSKANRALARARKAFEPAPQRYCYYYASGHARDEKGHLGLHIACDGIGPEDGLMQAALRQHRELRECERVRITAVARV